MDISISTIYKILILDLNYTKKKVERRAIQIRFDDICRYTKEINQIEPIHERLIFLDETSMDNRDMLRKRGWFLRNSRPTIDGQFTRSKRISILAFIGVKGIIEAYDTENTFNRTKFFTCLRELVNSRLIRMNSVLIMDGAKIHLDPNIVNYLRSVGLFVLFLPSYCPFFNPIEILFSRLKGFVQKNFKENSSSEAMVLNEALVQLQNIDLTSTYQQCGYMICGRFDPSIAYNHYITVQNCEQRADDDSLSPE
jgi:transposase